MRVLSEMEIQAVVGGHIDGQGDPYSWSGASEPTWGSVVKTATSVCGPGNVRSVTYKRTQGGRDVRLGTSGVGGKGASDSVEAGFQCQSSSDSGSNGNSDSDSGSNGSGNDSGSDS